MAELHLCGYITIDDDDIISLGSTKKSPGDSIVNSIEEFAI